MTDRGGESGPGRPLALLVALLALASLALGLLACGDDEDGSDEIRLTKVDVTKNLEDASYEVEDASPGTSSLPSLVDVDFATGPDSGFESAIQVGGNGLEPFDAGDLSKTGFVLFYESEDQAATADEKIGSAEGQQRKGNALFIYGSGTEAPPEAFDEMIGAAEGN